MTNPTPRDSAQLPPLPDTVAAFRDKGTFTMPEQFYPADVIDAREALRAQAASVEPAIDLPKAHEAVRKVLQHHGLTVGGSKAGGAE